MIYSLNAKQGREYKIIGCIDVIKTKVNKSLTWYCCTSVAIINTNYFLKNALRHDSSNVLLSSILIVPGELKECIDDLQSVALKQFKILINWVIIPVWLTFWVR